MSGAFAMPCGGAKTCAHTARREGTERARDSVKGVTPPQGPGEINPRVCSRTRYERTVRLRRKLQGKMSCMRAFQSGANTTNGESTPGVTDFCATVLKEVPPQQE